MKILIVDAHPVIHHGLRTILEEKFPGSTFGGACHGQEAVDLMNQGGWDLAILDAVLPGRGGLDLLKQIRTYHPNLPVIMFSVRLEEEYALRAFKAGASGYVTKESTPQQLAEAIRKVIGGGKYVSPKLAEHLVTALDRDLREMPHKILSDREFEVLCMIAAGKTTTAIADLLSLSVKTVSTYRTRILEKLGLKTAPELVRYAIDNNLDLQQ